MNNDTAISHVAICSADLARATTFYIEVFGYEVAQHVDIGAPFEVLTELPVIDGRAAFLVKDGVKLELVTYKAPEMTGSAERRSMVQRGLTHMAYTVSDLDSVLERIARFGGTVLHHTRVCGPMGEMIFCTDCDGVRLELWQQPA